MIDALSHIILVVVVLLNIIHISSTSVYKTNLRTVWQNGSHQGLIEDYFLRKI